jgi:hypothetical protein
VAAPSAPNTANASLTYPNCHSIGTGGPMRGVGRFLVQHHFHHLLHSVDGDDARSLPQRVPSQGRDAARQKAPPPPPACRLLRRASHPSDDMFALQPFGSQQHNPRPLYNVSRHWALSRHALQRGSLLDATGAATRILWLHNMMQHIHNR